MGWSMDITVLIYQEKIWTENGTLAKNKLFVLKLPASKTS